MTTHNVTSAQLDNINKKVRRLNRRQGCEGACYITVLSRFNIDIYEDCGYTKWVRRDHGAPRASLQGWGWPARTVPMHVIAPGGDVPRVGGYRLAAAIEHTAAGSIVSRAPGCYDIDLGLVRDNDNTCDHCSTKRQRKHTFIVVGDDGSVKRIGRNCLADYVREDDLDRAVVFSALASYIGPRAISEEDFFALAEEGAGVQRTRGADLDTFTYLTAVAAAVRLDGWRSRSAWAGTPSSDAAMDLLFPGKDSRSDSDEDRGITEADHETAAKALAWADGIGGEGSTEYEHNLHVACSLPDVTPKRMGIVASVVFAFQRDAIQAKRDAERAEKDERGAASAHVGVEGERYTKSVTITSVKAISSDWGDSYLVIATDDAGCVIKTFTSCRWEEGRETIVTFRVKRHNEFRGQKETIVTGMGVGCKSKWVGVDGRVFGTKREMSATVG